MAYTTEGDTFIGTGECLSGEDGTRCRFNVILHGGGSCSGGVTNPSTNAWCPCPVATTDTVTVEVFDVANDINCSDCTEANKVYKPLLWNGGQDRACYFFLDNHGGSVPCETPILNLIHAWFWFEPETCEIIYKVHIEGAEHYDSTYETRIPFQDWDYTKTYTLECVAQVEFVCDFDNAYVTMQYVPDPTRDCEELHCGNKWGACKPQLEPEPVNLLSPTCNPEAICCCRCGDAVELHGTQGPGTGCGSGECSKPIVVATLGGVALKMSVPTAGTGGVAGDIVYFTYPGETNSGNAKSILDETVTGSAGSSLAHVKKCDGSDLLYVCRSLSPPYGKYESVGRNKNTLERHSDGTYSEIQGNTDPNIVYHFNSAGILQWIENKCPSTVGTGNDRWTITHDTGSSYYTDPFGRRATTTYDANGHPSKFEDAYGRATLFEFNSSGLPTKYTTPELCSAEMRYDTNKRLTTYIAPHGGRTSYAYDTDGWVSEAKYPDGGTYTFSYPDCNTTVITAPGGGKTTVTYDGERRITSITNLKAIRPTMSIPRAC